MDGQRRRDAYPHEEEAMSEWSPPASDMAASGSGFVPPEAVEIAAKPSPSWWQRAGAAIGYAIEHRKDGLTGAPSTVAAAPSRAVLSVPSKDIDQGAAFDRRAQLEREGKKGSAEWTDMTRQIVTAQ